MSLDSAFKSSASASPQPQPGVWIQYKQVRARTLQTATQEEQHSGQSKLNILHEFHLDLHALFLDLPGVVMNNVRIIWGTGQVRATYGVYGREFCEIVKFMVKRASTKFIEVMSKRSISRIHYVEDGTQHITANLPDSLPSLTSSYVLPQPPDGSSIRAQSPRNHLAKIPRPLAGRDAAYQSTTAVPPRLKPHQVDERRYSRSDSLKCHLSILASNRHFDCRQHT
ncbi:hypothetical protein C8T65DRAFT_117767 [Cerioporus squamosus]|nr:hypothetical protein C8T65DRAFT_117767 [Cerioporus squamosus]